MSATAEKVTHTPGPWEIDNSTFSQGHDIYSGGENSELLASVYPVKHDGLHNSWRGNVQLMSQAWKIPDLVASRVALLDVLTRLIEIAKEHGCADWGTDKDVITEAEALIRKAKSSENRAGGVAPLGLP